MLKTAKENIALLSGHMGLGVRNDRRDRLIKLCQEHNLVLINTFFELPKRCIHTWKSPTDNEKT